jgi:hypothetical protein
MEVSCRTMLSVHARGSQWTQSRTYMAHQKVNSVHLEKRVVLVRTIGHSLRGFSTAVFLSVGHYPCYGSPDFSIIKSFSALIFPPRFFQGHLPKNIVWKDSYDATFSCGFNKLKPTCSCLFSLFSLNCMISRWNYFSTYLRS